MDHLRFFCLVFVMPLYASVYLCLVVTSWLSFVVSNCEFVTFPLVSWVRYLIVLIPDLCTLTSSTRYLPHLKNLNYYIIDILVHFASALE